MFLIIRNYHHHHYRYLHTKPLIANKENLEYTHLAVVLGIRKQMNSTKRWNDSFHTLSINKRKLGDLDSNSYDGSLLPRVLWLKGS